MADIAKTVDTRRGLQGLHDVQPSAGMKRVLGVVACLGIDANYARGVRFCWCQMMVLQLQMLATIETPRIARPNGQTHMY